MSKKESRIIDQPAAAREIIFGAKLKELMEECGITLAIATVDATQQAQPTLTKEEAPAKKTKNQSKKK